jgi:hypothetical protein
LPEKREWRLTSRLLGEARQQRARAYSLPPITCQYQLLQTEARKLARQVLDAIVGKLQNAKRGETPEGCRHAPEQESHKGLSSSKHNVVIDSQLSHHSTLERRKAHPSSLWFTIKHAKLFSFPSDLGSDESLGWGARDKVEKGIVSQTRDALLSRKALPQNIPVVAEVELNQRWYRNGAWDRVKLVVCQI